MGQDTVYDRLKAEILCGGLPAGERLVTADIASRYGSSTNPVREALHQLRGEGLVEILPNRGARVRAFGIDFVRDVMEIEEVIEPYLARAFVRVATEEDVAELERIQSDIVRNDFRDRDLHHHLDTLFHRAMYDSHRNRLAVDLWFRHRAMLGSIGSAFEISARRRVEVIREHDALIEAVRVGDDDGAARIVAAHARGAAEHVIEHLQRAERVREQMARAG
jgi:DNA-binding GntR family transcriptional regulator